MHLVKKHLLILALVLPGLLPAQMAADGEELIEWSPSRKLTWDDYKASPQAGSGAAAATTTYLNFEYHIRNNEFKFTISCKFSRTRSWGLHKTDYILAHEQGHFDIAEVYARKLYKAVSQYRFNKNTFKDDLNRIYATITTEKEEAQNTYDRETNHSINKQKQEEWLKKISDDLNSYAAFAGYH